MLITHNGIRPMIHETAYVAPTAIVCGNVKIGANSRILFGAVVNGDEGTVEIGDNCVVMESVIIKGARKSFTKIGNHVLIEARCYLVGCVVEDNALLATGATVLNNSLIGKGAEVGINSIIYANTQILPGRIVPIGHVALGNNPTHILPANEQGKIWQLARSLNLSKTAWDIAPSPIGTNETITTEVTNYYAEIFAAHESDEIIAD